VAYSANAIANDLLTLAEQEHTPVSAMKLQKLMYYAQGWSLAIADEPILNEQIEAWKWGPVIRSVYHQFKEFGDSPITRKVQILRFARVDGKLKLRATVPTIEREERDPQKLEFTKALLAKVWDTYKQYTPTQLSNMTHAEGSPWDQIVKRYAGSPPKGTDIPQSVIKRYFKRAAQANE
jgi:uncharacterized phage-associated protein